MTSDLEILVGERALRREEDEREAAIVRPRAGDGDGEERAQARLVHLCPPPRIEPVVAGELRGDQRPLLG